jgi:predicted nucleic acid-binding protein
MNALFDTNILIDYLNGADAARTELARYERKAISIITVIEVLVGATPENEAAIRTWLATFTQIPLDTAIADRAVELRRQKKIRLPDAIILASAQAHGLLLVSRNTKDFPANEPGVHVPYNL